MIISHIDGSGLHSSVYTLVLTALITKVGDTLSSEMELFYKYVRVLLMSTIKVVMDTDEMRVIEQH